MSGYTSHAQVMSSRGFEVDYLMLPLLEALWASGIETQYSCQGSVKKRFWQRTEDAYILFETMDDALKFISNTFFLWADEEMRFTPAYAIDDEYRGIVRFPSSRLEQVTEHWECSNPLGILPVRVPQAYSMSVN